MTRLTDAIGKADELAGDRIREGRYTRFVEPTTCAPEVRAFLAEARYFFGRGSHVTDKGVRRQLDVQLLDYRVVADVILAIVQVHRDRIEPWMKFPKRKLVYHVAACPVGAPSAISDAVVLTLTGQRLHWYLRHGHSPLRWLALHDAALMADVVRRFPAVLAMAQADLDRAASAGDEVAEAAR